MRTLSPGHGVSEMTWNAPAPAAALPPTVVAAGRSTSGVASIGWVQPEAVGEAGAALPELGELPAHAVAIRTTSRLIGANRRTIDRALPPATGDFAIGLGAA